MAKKKHDKLDLMTKVTSGVAFGDTSNSAVRNILTEISKALYGPIQYDQMEAALDFFDWKCPYTGEPLKPLIEKGQGYAVDHIYPQNQSWCGLNKLGNLVFVTAAANSAKRGLDVETFMRTDTKALKDLDGSIRQQRLEKIWEFQTKYGYDPTQIRNLVRPLMEQRYKQLRQEQEDWIRQAMEKLDAEGIKPTVTKTEKSKNIDDAFAGKGYTYDEKLAVAACYLRKDEGLVWVEENCMKLKGRNGATAKYILNRLGIDTSTKSEHRGLLAKPNVNLDDEIGKATGAFKITLEEIKKRKI